MKQQHALLGHTNPYLDSAARFQTPPYTSSVLTVTRTYIHSLAAVGMADEQRTVTLHLGLNSEQRISEIKKQVQKEWHHSVERQELYFKRADKNVLLEDHRSIGSYGITHATST